MIRILTLLLVLKLFSFQVMGQKEFSDEVNTWFFYLGNHKFNKNWGLHTDFQYRRNDLFANKLQVLGRLGIEYYSKQGPQYTFGYAFSRQFPHDEISIYPSNEHRLWEQMSMNDRYGRISLQHRYRLEQRFLERWKLDDQDQFYKSEVVLRHRMRYRLMFQVPLNKKVMQDKTLFINVFDELMLNFGKGVDKNILDQNRFYIGLGWRFNSRLNLQVGYQHQYVPKSDGVQIERNHVLQCGVSYNVLNTQQKRLN
jgi:hypothetical protein